MSVMFEPQPIPDFAQFIETLVTEKGYTRNPCSDHCPHRMDEHAHLRHDGWDFITWADGRYSGYDLTLPARLVYAPIPVRNTGILAYDAGFPKWPEPGAWTPLRNRIPRRCYRADAGFMVHVQPDCRCLQ